MRQTKIGIVPANTRLTTRHKGIPAWDSLNAEQKQLFAYMMEMCAGFLEQTDYNVGRMLEAVAQLGQLDNTLVIYIIAAPEALAPGKHTFVFDFTYDGGGIGKGGSGTLSVDGTPVAQGCIDRTMPVLFSFDETFDVGEDTGTPVSEGYDVPFRFTGNIENLTVDLTRSGR